MTAGETSGGDRHGHGPGRGAPGGRTIGGRYELRGRLGAGGMGLVWDAHDLSLDRPVVLKELRVGADPDPQARARWTARMRREIRALAGAGNAHLGGGGAAGGGGGRAGWESESGRTGAGGGGRRA
ncbi:hypothetical protein ACFXEZ_22390, partial [Streptomyces hygroscopicus]